jgi:hypothetical protein
MAISRLIPTVRLLAHSSRRLAHMGVEVAHPGMHEEKRNAPRRGRSACHWH